MRAVDLLQGAKVKRSFPWWFIALDYSLAVLIVLGWYGGLSYLVYNLVQWL